MKQTHPALARMRREHGAWKLTFVVEGFDKEMELHVGMHYKPAVAEAAARMYISDKLRIPYKFIHLQNIERD